MLLINTGISFIRLVKSSRPALLLQYYIEVRFCSIHTHICTLVYFRFFWDIIMTLVYFVAFITIPFFMCFVVLDYETVRLDNVNPVIYVFCWIDIIGNCMTGFYDKNKDEIILDQGIILK